MGACIISAPRNAEILSETNYVSLRMTMHRCCGVPWAVGLHVQLWKEFRPLSGKVKQQDLGVLYACNRHLLFATDCGSVALIQLLAV